MDRQSIIECEDAFQLKTYKKFPLVIERGEGAYVWDADGRRLLDFYGGHAVALTGHCHPAVVKAIREQCGKLLFYSNAVYGDVRAQAAEALIGIAPKGLTKVFFSNSGAEANESAMRVARRHTGREEIVVTLGAFHGRTYGAMSAGGIEKYRTMHKPIHSGYRHVLFGDVNALREAVGASTAAVMMEPIQSMSGINVAPTEYYRTAREVCDRAGALLIFDEVQTGLGRTGRMFAGEHWGVTPDLITCAKGIASGVPMGATLIREEVAAGVKLGEHGATFGGGQIACAAALATIGVIRDERLAENAAAMGERIRESLSPVARVRGLGLLLGVECADAGKVQSAAMERGLIVGTSDVPGVVRLMPPLTIKETHVRECVEILKSVLEGKR